MADNRIFFLHSDRNEYNSYIHSRVCQLGVARAVQRSPSVWTVTGKPKAAERWGVVRTSGAGRAATTVPSRRRRAWVVGGGSSSRWWETRMVARSGWEVAREARAARRASRAGR